MNSSKEVIKLIKDIRTKKKISLEALSKKVGMAKSTLSRYESGERDFPINDIGKFAEALGTSVEYLLGIGENKKTPQSEYNYIPVGVAAGLPENVEPINAEKIILPDNIMGKWAGQSDILIMKVNGQSMNKTIPDQSLIAVKPITLDNLKDGDIVVYSDNHDYSVKRMFKQDNHIIFRPHSTDIRFTDYIVSTDNENLKIHGKVVVYIVELD